MLYLPQTARLLVFGGPYSNVRAMRALMAEARRLAVLPEHVICTGDVVAYCAEPEETVQRVREWGIRVVAGNCEESLAVSSADCGCNFDESSACDALAKSWFEYASARVSSDSRRWMGALPRTLRLRFGAADILVVHGGQAETARWIFASGERVIADELATADADLVIAGHCGLPFARQTFVHQVGQRLWFNPGVIGMPANDGDPRTWFGLVTADVDGTIMLETRRLAYDHAGAASALRQAGYAEPYARALETGLWPSLDILPPVERAMTGQRLEPVRALLAGARAPVGGVAN